MKLDVEMLLELAAGTRPERREELLERECPDPAVRRELVASLQYADDAESFSTAPSRGSQPLWKPCTSPRQAICSVATGSFR